MPAAPDAGAQPLTLEGADHGAETPAVELDNDGTDGPAVHDDRRFEPMIVLEGGIAGRMLHDVL